MSDPRNRILHFALGRVLRDESEVDQAAEIARAYERGERGSVKLKSDAARQPEGGPGATAHRNGRAPARDTERGADLATRRLRAEGPRSAPHPFSRKVLAAAAAVLLVGGAAWFTQRGGEAPPGVATGQLALLVDDRFEFPAAENDRYELEPGATFWVPAGSPADVRLASGAELEVEGRSLARLVALEHGPEVALEYGALRARSAASSGLTLSAPGVEIALAPATELEVRSEYDRRRPAPTGTASFAALEAEFEDSLGWLIVHVRAGTAQLTTGAASHALAADGELFIALGETPELVLAEEVDALVALIGELTYARPYPEDGLSACRAAMDARPALWLPLAASLEKSLRAETSSWIWRRQLLAFLAYDSTETSLRIARDIWLERPEEFTDDVKIALAERGAREFQDEAVATLTWYDERDEDTDPLPASIYLALRGGDNADLGVQYLQEAIQFFDAAPAKGWEEAPRALAAATALEALGVSAAWERAETWVATRVEDELAQGMLEPAVTLVLWFEFLRELERGSPRDARDRSPLQLRMQERVAARTPELESEQDVRDLLARLLAD